MKPEKGERGLWYVGTVGFATEKEAQAYIDRGMKHFDVPEVETVGRLYGLKLPLLALALLVILGVVAGRWLASGGGESDPEKKQRMAALLICQKAIASSARYGKTEYPPYPEVKSGDGFFLFLWKSGDFYFKNAFGADVPQSARCEVDKQSGRIQHLAISGKVLVN